MSSPSSLHLALLSAADPAGLSAGIEALSARPESGGSESPIRVHTLGPVPGSHRAALLLGDAASAQPPATSRVDERSRPVAFMFPGLGDHYLGMGEGLRSLAPFREKLDLCAELLAPELGVDIREVIFPRRAEPTPEKPAGGQKLDLRRMLGRDGRAPSADESRLNRTSFAQPALFAVEYALASVWREWGIRPDVMIGYSLGEYVAACLAGVLSLQDSLSLVARRAQLIEELPPGAMLAISLPESEVTPLLGNHLSISAVNGPELCVVAGPPEEIETLDKRLRERGTSTRRIQSSHAFHSKMMEPIAERVTRLAAAYSPKPPQTPYVSNVTGALITAEQATDPAYWATHLCRPVRFASGLAVLASRPERVLLEAGPGQTLSSMATLYGDGGASRDRVIVASMRHAYDPQPDLAVLLRSVSRLWLAGAALDWNQFPAVALATPGSVASAARGDVAPPPPAAAPAGGSDTERELSAIWKKLLNGQEFSRESNFFESGGNSLIATRLGLRISRAFGVELPLRRLYEVPKLAAMAAAIDALRPDTGGAPAAPAAAVAVKPEAASVTRPRFRLPNGLEINHQNDAETRHFYEDIFAHRAYVKHGVRIPTGVVFDVGANIGMFTLFAHTEAKDARIFSFEPAPPLFELLQRNVAEHGVRATLFNYGLSDQEREAPFTFYPRSSGMSSFHPDRAEERHVLKTIIDRHRQRGMAGLEELRDAEELLDVRLEEQRFTARLRRLSDVIREHRIEHVDLLKVDVQKCELEVLQGLDEGDWPKIGQVVLEVHDMDGRVGQVTSLLERRGFSVISEQDDLYVGTNIHNVYAVRRP